MRIVKNSPRPGVKLFLPPAVIVTALLLASSFAAYADPFVSSLKEKDLKKGEAVIAKLRGFEQQAFAPAERQKQRALVQKAYPALFVQVADLRESDLKTDLTTAVFLYEAALQARDDATVNCLEELRDVYKRLCVESRDASLSNFLRAKARLHTLWAVALINYQRGARDETTMAAIEEMRRERRRDLALGERAVAALRNLEKEVCAYASLGELQEHGTVARVSFEKLSGEVAEVLHGVDRILQSLPRGALFYALYRARNAYDKGVFFWEKTYRRDEKVVNANSFTRPDGRLSFNFDADAVNYTVVVNWRDAIRHTNQASTLIEALRLGQ